MPSINVQSMKNNKGSMFCMLLLIMILLASPLFTLADNDDPVFTTNGASSTPNGTGPPDPSDTPIDGGVGILLVAGAIYGVKKYRENILKKTDPVAVIRF